MASAAEKATMPISAICPRNKTLDSGFTLIELVVVIAIMGLLTSVVVPKLYTMERSARHSAQRTAIINEIGNLGYKAFATGKPFKLDKDSALDIPEGWKILTRQPIRYDFDGICSGGTVVLVSPDGSEESMNLIPPLCKPARNG